MTDQNAYLETAIKVQGESLGLGIQGFRRQAPELDAQGNRLLPPYFVVTRLSDVETRTGDNTAKRTKELVQVDVYQLVKNPDGSKAESASLMKEMRYGFRNSRFPTAPDHVWRTNIFSARTYPVDYEANDGLGEIRDSLTLEVWRDL